MHQDIKRKEIIVPLPYPEHSYKHISDHMRAGHVVLSLENKTASYLLEFENCSAPCACRPHGEEFALFENEYAHIANIVQLR